MKLPLIICAFVFCENFQMRRSSKAEHYFSFVQSGMAQLNACILKELSVDSSTDPMKHCGLQCNALSQSVGVDIIGNKAKYCRLLYGFPALIPAHTTSDETVRYQKVLHFTHFDV